MTGAALGARSSTGIGGRGASAGPDGASATGPEAKSVANGTDEPPDTLAAGSDRLSVARGTGSDGPQDGPADASDPEVVARILCLRQLDARARTRAELAAYLARKGVPPEPAGRVLDRFTQVGLIDDRALAESFVDSRHHEAGLGRRALTLKLRQRGVDEQVIESAVSVVDTESELSAARDLVRRKLRAVAGLEPQAKARRLVAMLARKGYPPGLAYQVVRESLAEVDLPADID